MKNYFIILAMFAFVIVPSSTLALQATTDTKPHTRTLPPYGTDKTTNATQAGTQKIEKIDTIKTKADELIMIRITSLNKLLTRLQEDKHLPSAEKASTVTDIQTTITGLTSLKSKIDADTRAADIRTDAKKIYTDFRIFVVYEPKTRYLVMIDTMQQVSTAVSSVLSRVQTYIAGKKDVGVNTSEAEALLNDAQNQLTTITATLATDKTTITSLTPASTNPDETFASVKQSLITMRKEFEAIRNDIKGIRQALKGEKPTVSATSSGETTPKTEASPTPTP